MSDLHCNRQGPAAVLLALSLACLAVTLVACGGGSGDEDHPTKGFPILTSGLFDARGHPSAVVSTRPADAPATRSGLYATPAQFAIEVLTAEPYTVLVDVDRAATPAAAAAAALADHVASTENRGVAHFVRSATPALAAAVADALTESGVERVFVVVGKGTESEGDEHAGRRQ